MIEIAIAETQKWPALPWLASVKQRGADGQKRSLHRAFATNSEAWQWVQRIANTLKEDSA